MAIEESKSWGPFWSYQLNSTANPAHLPQNWPNWPCYLADSLKTAPRILIFSIAMGAEYLFYMKSIENHARAFLALIILPIGTVVRPRFFDQVGHETMYASSGNKHFFTKSCHCQTYQN